MARLVVLYTGLFILLVLLPSAPDARLPIGPEEPPEETLAEVQLEEPPEAPPAGRVRDWRRGDSEWVESGKAESMPLLIRYLRSREEMVQLAALMEFAGMGPAARPAVSVIVKALSDPKGSVRVEAAATLIHLNARSKVAVHTLIRELKAEDAAARARAAWTIGQLVKPPEMLGTSCWGPDPPPQVARPWVGKRTLPALVEALRDREPEVRVQVAHTLARVGQGARPALPALTRALKDKEASVREAAAQALWRIDRRAAARAGAAPSMQLMR